MPAIFILIGRAIDASTTEEARKLARALGAELAVRGHVLKCFSMHDEFLERHAVEGYLEKAAGSQSVELVYTKDSEYSTAALEGVPAALAARIRRRPMPGPWRISYYRELAHCDGLIVLGGGATSHTSGLIALSSDKVVLTSALLGGREKISGR